jgi:cytochrome P450
MRSGRTTTPPTMTRTAPRRLPGVGHALWFARDPLGYVQALRAYGPVVRIYLGRVPVHVVNSPELIRQITVTDAAMFEKGRFYDATRAVLGDGLLTMANSKHRGRRRTMQPAFARGEVATYVSTMWACAARLAGSWQAGDLPDLSHEFHNYAIEVVTRAGFGINIPDRAVADVQWSIEALPPGMMLRTLSPVRFVERLPIPVNRRFDEAVRRMKRVVDDLIRASASAAAVGERTLIGDLMSVRDPDTGARLSHQDLHDEATGLLLAAGETAASSLAACFHELARHPEIESRLHGELDAVLAGRPASYEDLANLPYTQRVVREVLRLHTPTWLLMRRAVQPVELGPARIPCGGEVFYSLTVVHRDPALFTDPLVFDPDRWLVEATDRRQRDAYMPFGSGTRKCIGDNFALVEMVVAVAAIAGRWRLVPEPGSVVREKAGGGILALPGLSLRAVPRAASGSTPRDPHPDSVVEPDATHGQPVQRHSGPGCPVDHRK